MCCKLENNKPYGDYNIFKPIKQYMVYIYIIIKL